MIYPQNVNSIIKQGYFEYRGNFKYISVFFLDAIMTNIFMKVFEP